MLSVDPTCRLWAMLPATLQFEEHVSSLLKMPLRSAFGFFVQTGIHVPRSSLERAVLIQHGSNGILQISVSSTDRLNLCTTHQMNSGTLSTASI